MKFGQQLSVRTLYSSSKDVHKYIPIPFHSANGSNKVHLNPIQSFNEERIQGSK